MASNGKPGQQTPNFLTHTNRKRVIVIRPPYQHEAQASDAPSISRDHSLALRAGIWDRLIAFRGGVGGSLTRLRFVLVLKSLGCASWWYFLVGIEATNSAGERRSGA